MATPRPAAARTATSAGGPGEGALLVARSGGGAARGQALPVAGTHVAAYLAGFAAQVRVRQTFNNPFDRTLEAVYVFPLPHRAAVSDILVTVGDRRIKTENKKRAEAAEIFARARRQGRTAAMLEQERPNVFTQSVTNIAPGEVVKVEIVYDLALEYADGGYQFVYPMVVGPRDVPGTPTGKPPTGHGTAPDTDQVPDGSRITPPTLPAGKRSGRNITLEVAIDPGKRIRVIDSPTHDIAVDRDPEGTGVVVALVGRDRIPNKDFVLHYRLADASPVATALAHKGSGAGTFALMVEPPRQRRARAIAPKELVFLVDTSGSTQGDSLDRMKQVMRHALGNLNPRDTFRIVTFAGESAGLGAAPVPNQPAARRRALAAIDRLAAGGPTDLLPALRAVLSSPVPRGRLRVVCLLSDGFVGNEKAVLAEVERSIGRDTRLFTLGVGSSVNRYLLERLAEVGRGASQVLLPSGSVEEQVAAFYRRLRSPVLTDLEIDWGDLAVSEVWPRSIGDVYAGQPIAVVGRFQQRGARGRITVRGRLGGGKQVSFVVPVALVAAPGDHVTLPRLWARAAIASLERAQLRSDDPALVARITELGLTYRLATAYTSFVAVDEQRTREGRQLRTYIVPVDLPEGVTRTEEDSRVRRRSEPPREKPPVDDRDAGEEDEEEGASDASKAVAEPTPDAYTTSGGTEMVSIDERAPGRSWRFAVGLGAGDLDRAETGDLLVGSLHLRADRAITRQLSLGARLGFLLRPDRAGDRVPMAGILFELGTHSLWRGALRIMTGAGPVLVDGDSPGLGLSAALGLGRRLPIELRYQHALRSGDDAGALTLGLELAF